MATEILALVTGGTIVAVALLARLVPTLLDSSIGRVVLLLGLAVLPVVVGASHLAVGVARSSSTEFCMDCHEMERYGQSLFADSNALAAVHYQNRLLPRESTCYTCHTNYAMFGTIEAKLNGLKHVWVHYVTGVPDEIELYSPYPNSNCLHCHEDARSFLSNAAHQPTAELLSGETSCLECHSVAHDFEAVERGEFWTAPHAAEESSP